jgi:HEAT repeat protein
MDIQINLSVRYPTEVKLLKHALNGDTKAAERILYYLSSSNPILCQIMQKAIHDLQDSRIWRQLLRYLAWHRWDEYIDRDQRFGLDATERIDQAIIEVFTQDDHKWEKPEKETALLAYLADDTDLLIQQACAYLLALRGFSQAIPVLTDTIKNGTRKWQLRAIKALETLNDARCARPLLMALIMDRDEVHREARRALHNLGPLAKSVWIEALNHPDKHIRWEAARGLGRIGDVRAVGILAGGLLDESYAVRWATSDVLANLGAKAIPVILTILSRYPLNEQSRTAAYHALHGILSASIQGYIKPLLDALHGPAPGIEAPIVAQRLLLEWETTDEMKSKKKQESTRSEKIV